jgi:Ca2+:H+ antiporter
MTWSGGAIIGAILAITLLLGMGIAFLLGGFCRHFQEFNPVATRNHMTMMLPAVISLIIPSTFHNFVTAETIKPEQYVTLVVAVVLLVTYLLSLIFMLKTHPDFFESLGEEIDPAAKQDGALPGLRQGFF